MCQPKGVIRVLGKAPLDGFPMIRSNFVEFLLFLMNFALPSFLSFVKCLGRCLRICPGGICGANFAVCLSGLLADLLAGWLIGWLIVPGGSCGAQMLKNIVFY